MTNAPKPLLSSLELGTASADTLIWLTEMADRMGGEPTNLINDKSQIGDILTPAEAKSRLNEILGDKKNPYWVKDHPDNKTAIAKVFKLQQMANPGAATTMDNLRAGAAGQ
jgi:hypothetical protein